MVSTQSKPRGAGSVPIIYNNAPLELCKDCGGSGGYIKRDGSCPLTQIDLPSSTEALPASIAAAIMAGDGGRLGGTAAGMSPTPAAAIGGIIGGVSAGVAAAHASSTLIASPSTSAATTVSCSHAADPHNTCASIASGPGWCVCGESPNSYAVRTSTDLACGWTTPPPTASFDCSAATTTSKPATPPATANPAPSTPPPSSPNAGIAIELQLYSGPAAQKSPHGLPTLTNRETRA
ncbi:hypothetical protein HO133_001127 [Letharia lupina]|uniref:Uncharacterized protein n=1 Tax=Letharia lupina TaxID=560253 RepID=A0A8H6CF35_9LECA|nr:uncharacterized protein HO133_001127 [Letharia lupina]KAF6222041.1 hypothetical protein HO133_001127 [Letharia lupina]